MFLIPVRPRTTKGDCRMNLYFRLISTLIKSASMSRASFFDETRFMFRALPSDCDPNLHMTNSRYFAFCDIARVGAFIQFGILYKCLKQGWFPMVNAQSIRHFRGIKPLQQFEVASTFLGWDESYLYCKQRFIVDNSDVAVAHVRGGLIGKKGSVSPSDLASLLGIDRASPPLPKKFRLWKEQLESMKRPRPY